MILCNYLSNFETIFFKIEFIFQVYKILQFIQFYEERRQINKFEFFTVFDYLLNLLYYAFQNDVIICLRFHFFQCLEIVSILFFLLEKICPVVYWC